MGNLIIVVGHYGSGKTEFALNYALKRKAEGHNVVMSDLDIVNPYFCSKGCSQELQSAGIEIISNNFGNDWKIDALTLHPGIQSHFLGRTEDVVVDVGGNAVGAKVLGVYADLIGERSYTMFMVVNANRYETQSSDDLRTFMGEIEGSSGLKITGFVNNTHLCEESTVSDVQKGDRIVRELSAKTGIPIRYVMYAEGLSKELEGVELAGERFPVRLMVRPAYFQN